MTGAVRDRFGRLEIEYQHPKKTLRCCRLSESRRTLPHPHNRLVIDSNPTGPTIPSKRRSAPQAGPCNLFAITPPTTFQSGHRVLCNFLQFSSKLCQSRDEAKKLKGHRTHHRYRGRSFAISENYQRALFHVSASSKLLQQVSHSLPV